MVFSRAISLAVLAGGAARRLAVLGETLIFSVWRRCFAFFPRGQAGRGQPPWKKDSRLAKRKNSAFPWGLHYNIRRKRKKTRP